MSSQAPPIKSFILEPAVPGHLAVRPPRLFHALYQFCDGQETSGAGDFGGDTSVHFAHMFAGAMAILMIGAGSGNSHAIFNGDIVLDFGIGEAGD